MCVLWWWGGAGVGNSGWMSMLVKEAGRATALEELCLGFSALLAPVWRALVAAADQGSYRRVPPARAR